MKKSKSKVRLTEAGVAEFAIKFCDEGCRSIIETGCVASVRPRSKALYRYNTENVDSYMTSDVDSSLLYLRSRRMDDLPFKMTEKDGWIWFDKRKENASL